MGVVFAGKFELLLRESIETLGHVTVEPVEIGVGGHSWRLIVALMFHLKVKKIYQSIVHQNGLSVVFVRNAEAIFSID